MLSIDEHTPALASQNQCSDRPLPVMVRSAVMRLRLRTNRLVGHQSAGGGGAGRGRRVLHTPSTSNATATLP